MKKLSHNSKRGFTLIEMLIGVFIFTVAIAALTLMAGRGIRSSADAHQRITAEFLTLEGIEVVRNIRDSAFLNGLSETSWTGVFGDEIFGSNGCVSQPGDSSPGVCAFDYNIDGRPRIETCDGNCDLFLNSATRIYNYDEGTPTPFSRKIYITEINPGEINVRVRVEWENEYIEYEENLFLWG